MPCVKLSVRLLDTVDETGRFGAPDIFSKGRVTKVDDESLAIAADLAQFFKVAGKTPSSWLTLAGG